MLSIIMNIDSLYNQFLSSMTQYTWLLRQYQTRLWLRLITEKNFYFYVISIHYYRKNSISGWMWWGSWVENVIKESLKCLKSKTLWALIWCHLTSWYTGHGQNTYDVYKVAQVIHIKLPSGGMGTVHLEYKWLCVQAYIPSSRYHVRVRTPKPQISNTSGPKHFR